MSSTLETLLLRLRDARDGNAAAGELERARALVRADARIPEELRELALGDPSEAAADAAGLLAVLGADDLGPALAEAIRLEAGSARLQTTPSDGEFDGWEFVAEALRDGLRAESQGFEAADVVMRRLGEPAFPWGAVLADAVAAEAGGAAVADDVMRDVGGTGVSCLGDAVRAEAGSVDVADAVVAALALETIPIGDAVRAEAGSVDVAAAVMAVLRPAAVAPVAPSFPRPANNVRGFGLALVALAAAVLLAVVGSTVSSPPGGSLGAPDELLFAQAGDVIVEDLAYGDDVVVIQTEGEHGAVILWVEEGA